MIELILGGVRSGKSRMAERHAQESGLEVVYIATAEVLDEEMRRRIEHHKAMRPKDWKVVEGGCDLGVVLLREAGPRRCLLVDCLTLWMTRLLCGDDDLRMRDEMVQFLQVLPGLPGTIILVSNETNMGITPMGELSRRYCDETGRLHQRLGEICDKVILTVAGLPLMVKDCVEH